MAAINVRPDLAPNNFRYASLMDVHNQIQAVKQVTAEVNRAHANRPRGQRWESEARVRETVNRLVNTVDILQRMVADYENMSDDDDSNSFDQTPDLDTTDPEREPEVGEAMEDEIMEEQQQNNTYDVMPRLAEYLRRITRS